MTDTAPSDKPKDDQEFEFPALHAEEPAPAAAPAAPVPAAPPPPAPSGGKGKSFGLFLAFALVVGGMFLIRKMRSAGETPPEEQQQQQQAPDEVPVNAIEARIGRFQDTINAVGTLKGEAEVELRFQVEGRIDDLMIQEGGRVKKGQLLGRLSDRDAQLKTQRAKIELEQTEKLYQIGGVSKTKLDEARLNLEVAQTELDKTRLIASREGIIGEKEAEVGEFVNPQRKIAKLVAIKNVVVEVGIIEKQVDKVYPGQKILITVDAYPGNIFEGTIETISPIIGSDGSKTFSVRSKIPNPDSLLLPGMFARSKIITYEADDAISVPNDALNKTPGGFQVFVINKENVAEARDVQVGYVATEFTQVESGLNPGEIVVVQKPPELKAGSKVKIIEVQK
jgi:RND family efflux transporter MFP subunit